MDAAAKELKSLGRGAVRRLLHGSVRRADTGHSGHVRQPAIPQRCGFVFRRLIRSLPTRSGVIGVATCDKGLPAMMMALAGTRDLPCVLIPGGVTLLAEEGEDAGLVQSSGARFAHGQITLEAAAANLCHACASPGGGCQFLGTAATSQVVAEALGMALTHSALAPSGHPIWTDMARRSARAVLALEARGIRMRDILTEASVQNAMVVHAAFGGSTNLILHLPAMAHAAGLRRPGEQDWTRVNKQVPRLVDALPNGPKGHPDRSGIFGRRRTRGDAASAACGPAALDALTVSGETLGRMLDWWEQSERRAALRRVLKERDGIDPDEVIMDPASARRGADLHGHVPEGQSGAGGIGDQEHGDRSEGGGCGRRVPEERAGARVHVRGGGHCGDQEPGAGPGEAGRRDGADLPRADGVGNGGDLSRSPPRCGISISASTWR